MTVLRPVVVLAPPAGHSSSHGWPGSPALFKRQAEASPQQKSETCCQEKTCVADPTMGQRDPAREPDTEPGGVARPSEYRRAGALGRGTVMSLTTAPGMDPALPQDRPPPRPRPNLGRGGGEGNHECVCSGNVLVL